MEIVLAAFVPAVAFGLISRLRCFDDGFRRVSIRWFIPLTLVWYSAFWTTGRSPAPFDFLAFQIPPWNGASADFVSDDNILSDAVTQFIPWREIVTDAYRHGELPLLNRYAGSGSSLWSNPQACVLCPTTLLGIPFSSFAWPLFAAVCNTFVALAGMYLFLRSEDVSERAATFGAIAFAFCAYNFAFALFPHTNVSVLLPWLLFAIRRNSIAGSAISAALMLLGGHPESVLIVAIVAVPFAIREIVVRRATLLRLAAAAAIAALLAAPVLLPFVLSLPNSERYALVHRDLALVNPVPFTFDNAIGFIFPAHFWRTRATVPVSNFNEAATQYAGLSTLALLLCAIAIDARRQRFWLVMFVVLLPFAFDSFAVHAAKSVPLLGETSIGRVRLLLAFITAVVAARVIDRVSRRAIFVASIIVMAMVALTIAVYWARYQSDVVTPIVMASAAESLLLLIVAAVPRARPWLPLLLFSDLAVLGMSYHTPNDRRMFYPMTPALRVMAADRQPYRVAGVESALFPNTGAMVRLESIGVHDPTADERYEQMLALAGFDRTRYFNRFHTIPRKEMLDRLGVRYVIAEPRSSSGALPVVYRGRDAVVFRNDQARHRFFSEGAEVKLERYGRNGAELSVRAARPALVSTTEIAIPGWRAECDGATIPFSSKGPFLEWKVPAGQSRCVLRYRPPGLIAGAICALIGGISLLLQVVWPSAITRSPFGRAV